jgi:hypothetical protein
MSLDAQMLATQVTSDPQSQIVVASKLPFKTAPAFPLVIHRAARTNQPFSVTGQRAILGQQDGTFAMAAAHQALTIRGAEPSRDGFVLNAQGASAPSADSYETVTVHSGW